MSMERTIYQTATSETEDERQADRLARSETPVQRARRIRARKVDPAQIAALRRLWAV